MQSLAFGIGLTDRCAFSAFLPAAIVFWTVIVITGLQITKYFVTSRNTPTHLKIVPLLRASILVVAVIGAFLFVYFTFFGSCSYKINPMVVLFYGTTMTIPFVLPVIVTALIIDRTKHKPYGKKIKSIFVTLLIILLCYWIYMRFIDGLWW